MQCIQGKKYEGLDNRDNAESLDNTGRTIWTQISFMRHFWNSCDNSIPYSWFFLELI